MINIVRTLTYLIYSKKIKNSGCSENHGPPWFNTRTLVTLFVTGTLPITILLHRRIENM